MNLHNEKCANCHKLWQELVVEDGLGLKASGIKAALELLRIEAFQFGTEGLRGCTAISTCRMQAYWDLGYVGSAARNSCCWFQVDLNVVSGLGFSIQGFRTEV